MKRVRQSVSQFARLMEERLQKHDHKGRYGWAGYRKRVLLEMLHGELCELSEAVFTHNEEEIRKEAADLANFAMMIADRRSIL